LINVPAHHDLGSGGVHEINASRDTIVVVVDGPKSEEKDGPHVAFTTVPVTAVAVSDVGL
jgi:hypothetical protein